MNVDTDQIIPKQSLKRIERSEGLDDIALMLQHEDKIREHESRRIGFQ